MTGILFLRVTNSARSQMAEGIARSLAPASTRVWSAGSHPTSVCREAVAVLGELGIRISQHHSKTVDEIHVPMKTVDEIHLSMKSTP